MVPPTFGWHAPRRRVVAQVRRACGVSPEVVVRLVLSFAWCCRSPGGVVRPVVSLTPTKAACESSVRKQRHRAALFWYNVHPDGPQARSEGKGNRFHKGNRFRGKRQ